MTVELFEFAPADLAGQVALVTGGGRGIGKAIAERLAAAGARVALTARSGDELDSTVRAIEEVGGRARGLPADITDRVAVEAVVSEAERSDAPISLLVNLRGAFLCTRAVLPGMVARRQGRIVNIASIGAVLPIPDGTAYGSSKTALVRFTESVALEVEASGIGVFAIDPGNVPTGMHDFLAGST